MTFDEIRKDFFVSNKPVRRKDWPKGKYWRFLDTIGMVTKYESSKPKGVVDAHEWATNVFNTDDWEIDK